jgi:hypothetical protein
MESILVRLTLLWTLDGWQFSSIGSGVFLLDDFGDCDFLPKIKKTTCNGGHRSIFDDKQNLFAFRMSL